MAIWQQTLPNNIWLVGVNGRLDQQQTPDLEQRLRDMLGSGHNRLIIDLTQVTYINSGGLRALVTGWRETQQQNGRFVLCGLGPRLQEIFEMVGFDQVFQIYETRTAAQEAFVR